MVQVRKKNGCAEKMALGLGVCRYWVFVGDCFDFRFQAPGRRFAFIAEQDTILIYTFQDCLSRSVIGPVSMKMKSGVYSQPSPNQKLLMSGVTGQGSRPAGPSGRWYRSPRPTVPADKSPARRQG